ncbi:MAG: type IV toxin-antitoxin system AbiEi family antitoxin domain-containing protein [Actinobacteria bacterium]|nr:type IV toxin-antitoxin system AbiEi family antitoxin domain-containing protein [Actinomycetota bacterium]
MDLLIGRVAARQHGVVTSAQLSALGLSRGALAHRIRRGLLHPMHRGVYLWGPPEPFSRELRPRSSRAARTR